MGVSEPILEAENLKQYFIQNDSFIDTLLRRKPSQLQAVDDVSFTLGKNQSIGVIGESGCGKTTLIKTVMGLYTPTDGEIRYRGKSIRKFDKQDWKNFRRNVQIIFQDPFNTLNPRMTIRESLMEPLKIHGIPNKSERVYKIMREVELNPPERYLDRLPGQLSGGEKQRISIARALIIEPDVILADEPVSMLDVSTQAAILKLLASLRDTYDVSLLYISHDLSTVAALCDEINVMYLGRIVERAETLNLINDPQHPYSKALINAIPTPTLEERKRVKIEGAPPDPINLEEGCRFRDRCPEYMEVCDNTPAFVGLEDRHVACHLYYEHADPKVAR